MNNCTHTFGLSATSMLLAVVCTLCFGSCDESLPPRDDPRDYLVSSVSARSFQTRTEDYVMLAVTVHNVYSETFSDSTEVYGIVTLQWDKNPQFQKTFRISAADIMKTYYDPLTQRLITTKADYFPASKRLTLPENEYVAIQLRWDLIGDNGADLRNEPLYVDPSAPTYKRSEDFKMIVTSGIHLYTRSPMVYSKPFSFTFNLHYPI